MYVEVFNFFLIPASGLRCVWLTYPVLCPYIGARSMDWAQLCRNDEETGLRDNVFVKRNRTMDNVQKLIILLQY
jgi:hypothetical protein